MINIFIHLRDLENISNVIIVVFRLSNTKMSNSMQDVVHEKIQKLVKNYTISDHYDMA